MKTPSPAPIGPAGVLRLTLRLLGLLGWLLCCLILYLLCSPLSGPNPAARLFLTGTLRLIGGQLTVTGKPVQAPSILLANHLSWIDILALAAATGSAFVAHDGLADHPVMRFLCHLNRTVFIARGNRADVSGQIKQVKDGLENSGVLTLFPEGTTGDGVHILPFKSSLLSAVEGSEHLVAIRPVCVDYPNLNAEIAWTDRESGLANFARILARPGRLPVSVHLLDPLDAAHRSNRKIIAMTAEHVIAAKLASE